MKFLAVLGAIIVLFSGYFYYSQSKISTLEKANTALSISVENQRIAINRLNNTTSVQLESIENIRTKNASLLLERSELVDKLMKHDWEILSREKPGLMERNLNNGTKELFDTLIDLTSP